MSHTVTSIVRGASPDALRHAFQDSEPDRTYDLELAAFLRCQAMGRPDRDLGERFHVALAEGFKDHWVEPRFWPFVREIKDWLRNQGVVAIHPEWEFRYSRLLRGTCDLLVKSGPNRRGVIEVKLVGDLPDEPPADDHCQLGLYAMAAAERYRDFGHYWGALAYVCPVARCIRIHEWTSMESSCHAARQVLRAA